MFIYVYICLCVCVCIYIYILFVFSIKASFSRAAPPVQASPRNRKTAICELEASIARSTVNFLVLWGLGLRV